jgi:hypothetical protein
MRKIVVSMPAEGHQGHRGVGITVGLNTTGSNTHITAVAMNQMAAATATTGPEGHNSLSVQGHLRGHSERAMNEEAAGSRLKQCYALHAPSPDYSLHHPRSVEG